MKDGGIGSSLRAVILTPVGARLSVFLFDVDKFTNAVRSSTIVTQRFSTALGSSLRAVEVCELGPVPRSRIPFHYPGLQRIRGLSPFLPAAWRHGQVTHHTVCTNISLLDCSSHGAGCADRMAYATALEVAVNDNVDFAAGHGLSQQDFLIHDTCVTVNDRDEIQGALSKKECHQFLPTSPTGHLHRAFSVFLFNSENKLLLQQRASDKITFPDVRLLLLFTMSGDPAKAAMLLHAGQLRPTRQYSAAGYTVRSAEINVCMCVTNMRAVCITTALNMCPPCNDHGRLAVQRTHAAQVAASRNLHTRSS